MSAATNVGADVLELAAKVYRSILVGEFFAVDDAMPGYEISPQVPLLIPALRHLVDTGALATDASGDEIDSSYWIVRTGTTKARRNPKFGKTPRIYWRYAPVPLTVLDDPKLSVNAKAITAAIVRLLNLGPWNTDLHIDARYDDLARLASVSRSTAIRAVAELVNASYLEVVPLGGRAGCRLRFRSVGVSV